MIDDPDLARRAVEALERIADSLDKLVVTSRTDVPAFTPDDEWVAAPMRGRRKKFAYPVLHAVHDVGGRLVTACAASGCGLEVDKKAAQRLEALSADAWRCSANGCRKVYAEHAARTESS
jgi:hypothetical protein